MVSVRDERMGRLGAWGGKGQTRNDDAAKEAHALRALWRQRTTHAMRIAHPRVPTPKKPNANRTRSTPLAEQEQEAAASVEATAPPAPRRRTTLS